MKAIIYAGIGLFSVATVYGVVDYYNTNSKGTLDKMYKEEGPLMVIKKEKTPSTLPVVTEITKAAPDSSTVAPQKGSKRIKLPVRRIKFDDFSRGRIVPEGVIVEEIKTDSTASTKENQ